MRTSILLALALCTPAIAARPPETSLGDAPDRLHVVDPQVQALGERSEGWRAFTDAEGVDWDARFDPITVVPHRMWGPGIDLGPVRTAKEIDAAALGFVRRHAALFGVDGATLRVRTAARVGDAIYVDVDAMVDGLSVFRGGVTLRFKHDRLVMAGADAYPGAPVTGEVRLSAADAMRAAATQGKASLAEHHDGSAELMLLPQLRGAKATLRRVWFVRSRTDAPVGHWESLVDAETGALLYTWNTVRFLDGHVDAEHDVRLGDGALMTSPLPFAWISNGADDTDTDAGGAFTLDDTGAWRIELDGPQLRVIDDLGDSDPSRDAAPPWTLTADDFGGRQAPLTTWVYVHEAKAFGASIDPTNGWVDEPTRATVNIDDVCNAYFDGDVNFFRSGAGCNNTGRLADVIFHEWGHGFHAYAIVTGFFDGSLGEGAADVYSTLITGDSRIAPNFFTGGAGTLRNTANRNRFPDDYSLNDAYIHTNGLIFGGAMWDTRQALERSMSEDDARDTTGRILAGLLRGGPTIEQSYDEAVFADDDDGDLGNGTPHQCELVEGFGKHGLGPEGGQGIEPDHDPLTEAEAEADIPVVLSVNSPAPECFDVTPVAATAHFRVNGGRWTDKDLKLTALDVDDALPAAQLGDLIEYWVEIEDQSGAVITEPPGGPIRPHTFHVGDALRIRCDDFEQDDGGYTHKLLSGDDVEGADDWTWGPPSGAGGDPMIAASGRNVWGNDLGGGNYNGQYQDDKTNALISPKVSLRHYDGAFLRYKRWLNVEDGVFDQAKIYSNDEEIWSNWSSSEDLGTEHHLDDRWADHVVRLGAPDDDRTVRVRFEITSDAGLTFGGWTLDDICFYAPATADNRLGVADLTATRTPEGIVAVSWTQPRHAPVQEVVLVRKAGGFPTGPSDGQVLWRTTDVALDAPITVVDPFSIGRGNLFYAVYASDGDAWLSWTREGFNAASVDALDGDARRGCGCAATGLPGAPAGSGAAAFGLVGAALLRRRRR